jgi:ACR3 family arsenite efflux pump ArsB
MYLEILKILYKFGKISALTSPSTQKKKLNHFQRYQTFLIFALYLVGVILALGKPTGLNQIIKVVKCTRFGELKL